ncbi:hypothetical protein WMY93_001499 [Mugilogobius chulae]|uniref:Chemokine interleukin-8-like domain-containing protein n=1 Tax=Mugilogobius chulae TaxID=88201 RepID=A0AAW0Q2F4_9GOBI
MNMCCRTLLLCAIFAGVLTMVTLAAEQKITKCCTEVSIANVTAPIVGYRIQRKNPPCVRAVIFETTEGEVCSHWKQDWVFGKIKELEESRRTKKNTTVTAKP